jgi:hypothetical protein
MHSGQPRAKHVDGVQPASLQKIFFSSALYPLWRLREGGSEALYYISLANPFTHAVGRCFLLSL